MASSYRDELRRLSIDIPKEIHKNIVIAAYERNCSIKKWVLRLIVHELKRNQEYEKRS